MSRAERREKTKTKHARRQRLWRAIHPHAEVGHKAKFWPMRCRCGMCSLGRTRDERATYDEGENA